MTPPKQTPREKKDCVTAAYQTEGSTIFFPGRFKEKYYPVDSSVQRDGSYQQAYHYNVGKEREKVGRFAGTFHPFVDYQKDECPAGEEAEDQAPGWSSQSLFNSCLVQNDLAEV